MAAPPRRCKYSLQSGHSQKTNRYGSGSVLEFVAPDFHLRKLDGSVGASDVAGFFEKAQMEGKQVWYITAPASLPVTVVQDLTIPMDQAQKGLPVLTHNGDDYRLAFDDPSASSSFRLLIPHKKGQKYSERKRYFLSNFHCMTDFSLSWPPCQSDYALYSQRDVPS